MLREVLYNLDELNERLAALNARIRKCTAPHEDIIQRLDAVLTKLGGDYLLKRNPEQERRRAVRKLETFGFAVVLVPAGT
jgi:hypothetical protein